MNELVGKRLLPARTLQDRPRISISANLGLVFDKYSGEFECDGERLKFNKKVARDCIKEAAPFSYPIDDDAKKRLKAMREAMSAVALRAGGRASDYVTEGPFVTGLGMETPLENGMTLHPTLGVPYLPGSGVKGMVRNWAELWADPAPAGEDIAARVFGPRLDPGGEGADARAGSIVFFDALPHEDVRVEEDVMTPHYQDYYQDYYQSGVAPGDWINPNPIPFFVVPANVRFTFPLAPRRRPAPRGDPARRHADGLEDLKLVCGWLEEALVFLGAGAKTKSGYGRFRPA
jgi:CRISPR-associated protein Cmr6